MQIQKEAWIEVLKDLSVWRTEVLPWMDWTQELHDTINNYFHFPFCSYNRWMALSSLNSCCFSQHANTFCKSRTAWERPERMQYFFVRVFLYQSPSDFLSVSQETWEPGYLLVKLKKLKLLFCRSVVKNL